MEVLLRGVLMSEHSQDLKKQLIQKISSNFSQQTLNQVECDKIYALTLELIQTSDDAFSKEIGLLCMSALLESGISLPRWLISAELTIFLEKLFQIQKENFNSILLVVQAILEETKEDGSLYPLVTEQVSQRIVDLIDDNINILAKIVELFENHSKCVPSSVSSKLKLCRSMVNVVSRFQLDSDKLIVFFQQIYLFQRFLTKFFSQEENTEILKSFLNLLFALISSYPSSFVSTAAATSSASPSGPSMSSPSALVTDRGLIPLVAFVSSVPESFLDMAVRSVVFSEDVSESELKRAFTIVVQWIYWPLPSMSAYLIQLFIKHLLSHPTRKDTFYQVARSTILLVTDQFKVVPTRKSAMIVLSEMLIHFPNEPEPFHSTLPILSEVVSSLKHDNNPENSKFLLGISMLIHINMVVHPGYPDMYSQILRDLEGIPVPDEALIQEHLRRVESKRCIQSCAISSSLAVKPFDGLTGLQNLGNTCYANCVIQALNMCYQFKSAVLEDVCTGIQPVKKSFRKLFASLTLSQRPDVAPEDFLQVSCPPWFTSGHQQDCSEYLRYVLDTIREQELEESSRIPVSEEQIDEPRSSMNLIENLFEGVLRLSTTCLVCQSVSERSEKFLDYSLFVHQPSPPPPSCQDDTSSSKLSVQKLFDQSFQVEKFQNENQYFCEKCAHFCDAERISQIAYYPKILLLTLNRFSFQRETNVHCKIKTLLDYSTQLTTPHADIYYSLFAIVVHSGESPNSGHYYAIARQSVTQEGPDGLFYLFNDHRLSRYSFEEFTRIADVFKSDSPYVLFYARNDQMNERAEEFRVPAELCDEIAKDNCKYAEEQKRQKEQNESLLSNVAHYKRWHDSSDDPPGNCGGPSGLDSMPRFVY